MLSPDGYRTLSVSGNNPVVSVGVPTYNRADLLDKRLKNITSQTFASMEIVVSDNASSDPAVDDVIARWMARDGRIRRFRQETNIGPYQNFHFVLSQSQGRYFIWASDDDEWSRDFLHCCVESIAGAQLYIPSVQVHYLSTDQYTDVPIPLMDQSFGKFENAIRYFSNMQPSIIYGLHDRSGLSSIIKERVFDLSDVLIVVESILRGGVRTGGRERYIAGVAGSEYKIQFFGRPGSTDKISYRTFYFGLVSSVVRCRDLSIFQRVRLICAGTVSTIAVIGHITTAYPAAAHTHHSFIRWIGRAGNWTKRLLEIIRGQR